MARNQDLKDQIEQLEHRFRSIEAEIDAAITLASRKALSSHLTKGFGQYEQHLAAQADKIIAKIMTLRRELRGD